MDKKELQVRTDFAITVEVQDKLFKPVIHRYLDLLVGSLRNVLRHVDFAQVCNTTPYIYIQNHPLQVKQVTTVTGKHTVRSRGGSVTLGLGELSSIWQVEPEHQAGAPQPYSSAHAETYYANSSKLNYRECIMNEIGKFVGK